MASRTAFQSHTYAGSSARALANGAALLNELDSWRPSVRAIEAEIAPIIAKLRAETKETFRFIRDNPIIQVASMGLVSGVQTTKIAAVVWGRDEQGGMDFRQQDLDALIVDIDHFAPTYNPMYSVHGVHILNLCVSDVK